jgi:hypothetical protein
MTVSKDQREALKATLKKLRDERGAAVDDVTRRNKERQAARKKVRAALAAGPTTVPAIAAASGLSSQDVLWHVAGMRKYGDLVETGTDGDYPTYALLTATPATAGDAPVAEAGDA